MNISETIYLDHQATTPVDQRVSERMLPYFRESFGNPHSADHILGWKSSLAVEQAAAQIAGLISADSDEIIFTSGATEANNMALLGLARRVRACKHEDDVLSSARLSTSAYSQPDGQFPTSRVFL